MLNTKRNVNIPSAAIHISAILLALFIHLQQLHHDKLKNVNINFQDHELSPFPNLNSFLHKNIICCTIFRMYAGSKMRNLKLGPGKKNIFLLSYRQTVSAKTHYQSSHFTIVYYLMSLNY